MILLDHPLPEMLRITLDRPERHNAVDRAMVKQMTDALADDGGESSVVVLCSKGSFCAGLDLSLPERERAQVSDALYRLYAVMVSFPRPIVVAARGHAIGAGAQLLAASDLRVGAPDLGIRFPGPEHGLAVGTWALPGLVGRGRAVDLCLTMRPVDADEALRIGLIDRLAGDPEEVALDLAAAICKLDREAVTNVKHLVTQATGHPAALAREAAANKARAPVVRSKEG